MDLKKKLAKAKTKIKEYAPEITAVVSTGALLGVFVAIIRAQENHNETLKNSNAALAESNETLEEMLGTLGSLTRNANKERVYLNDETEQQILDGSKDVWFDVNGKRFDLILHRED